MMNNFMERIDAFTAHFEKAFLKTLGKPPSEELSSRVVIKRADAAVVPVSEVAYEAENSIYPTESGKSADGSGSSRTKQPEEHIEDDESATEWMAAKEKKRWFGFIRNPRFWLAFVIGQILSLCLTCTNSMTTGMGDEGTNIPLLQNLLNYALLAIVHNTIMLYKYGFKKTAKIFFVDSWRFFIMAFVDVQGNYFVTLAYEYTNMLSAALLDNFAIVVVVILSFVFLHVRYHWTQYIGICVTIGGMALLIVSDRLTGKDYDAPDVVKGDLFVLLGAACYGFSNTFEEFLVSERPIYEVLGNMAFWATCINAVQMGIFDRHHLHNATWNGKVGGYLTGYVMTMFLLYHLCPFLFRITSAAFYNLSILTSDFWALLVGTEAFGYSVFWLYPVGFVFTVLGIVFYCAAPLSGWGEAVKPWLGDNQELGVSGLGTARRDQVRHAKRERREEETVGSRTEGASVALPEEPAAHESYQPEFVQPAAHGASDDKKDL